MKPVDCHCHLDFKQFDSDRENVIERCESQLKFVVTAGTNFKTNKKASKLEENHKVIKANLGLHPTYTDSFNQIEEIKNQIKSLDPVAVGEIGLDHHHIKDESQRDLQEKVFRELLELAEKLDKPVVVHSRDAEQKVFKILREYDLPEILLHCFNGSPDLAKKAVQHDMAIGVTTQVLYSKRVQNIVKALKIEDIVLETDSPFLYQGERNEPVNVKKSAEKIGDLKSVDAEKVVRETSSNAERIFS